MSALIKEIESALDPSPVGTLGWCDDREKANELEKLLRRALRILKESQATKLAEVHYDKCT